MTASEQRAAVIAEALTWRGTPWRHMADKKGAGVDCLMLLVRAFVDTGAIAAVDPRPYPQQWFLHHDEERYIKGVLGAGAREIGKADAQPGDVALFRFGRCYSHGGIIVDGRDFVHAWARIGAVSVTPLGYGEFAARPAKYYTVW